MQFEGYATILPGSKWSCLLLHVVLQDSLSEVTKIYSPLKLRVFVDDNTEFLMEKNREVVEMSKNVMKKLNEEVTEKASNCQLRKIGRQGKS